MIKGNLEREDGEGEDGGVLDLRGVGVVDFCGMGVIDL